ncbi:hypothetical protein KKG19_01800, partial [Patescibacteria group bacterium]|nr:hypothetical protein [Patescibacteria group bacterium]
MLATTPRAHKGIFIGIGLTLSLVLLISVFTVTEFFGFYTPESSAADYNISCNSQTVTAASYGASDNLNFINGTTDICILSGSFNVASVTVQNGVTLTHANADATGVTITTSGNFTINSSASINVDSKGCQPPAVDGGNGFGPNVSNSCGTGSGYFGWGYGDYSGGSSGGSHGGFAGRGQAQAGVNEIYDDSTAPVLFGATGGNGRYGNSGTGAGGGKVRLDVGGTFRNNGSISADGGNGGSDSNGNYSSGAGGGSIYITANIVSDGGNAEGTFTAVGGNGGGNGVGGGYDGGAGAGGSIAIIYTTNDGTNPFNFDSGDFVVTGGDGYEVGTPSDSGDGDKGTVFVKDTTNSSATIYYGFNFDDTDHSVTTWTNDSSVENQFCFTTTTTPSITASNITLRGNLDCTQPTSLNSFDVTATGTISFDGLTFTLDPEEFFNVSGGDITLSNSTSINANVNWTNLDNLTINSGTSIAANEKGCIPPYGSGTGVANGNGPNSSNVCGTGSGYYGWGYGTSGDGVGTPGASHGGRGGRGQGFATITDFVDTLTAPTLFGATSGNENWYRVAALGNGGGAVRLDVNGTYVHNGTISVNGGTGGVMNVSNGSAGGGAGGSIYITTDTISDGGNTEGSFAAAGGDGGSTGADGGGGGGGRISIIYTTNDGVNPFTFASTDFDTSGGDGWLVGTPGDSGDGSKGSVYIKDLTTNDVTIYHAFDFDNTAFSTTGDWTFDASATDQFCRASATTPSLSVTGNLAWPGTLQCTPTSLTSFTVSVGGNLDFDGTDITLPSQKTFTITSGAVTLSNGATVNANIDWSGLDSLTLNNGTSVIANTLGCQGTATDCANGKGPNTSNVCGTGGGYYGWGYGSCSGSGSGASHGGLGGQGQDTSSVNAVYDVPPATPVLFGASGGNGRYSPVGGAGGGLIKLAISGPFVHNGTLSTNGGNGQSDSNGSGTAGGSGGSINISVNGAFSGNGILSSIGGNGYTAGSNDPGGGGGGRVYYGFLSSSFSGSCIVTGGTGYASGGVGTCNPVALDDPPVISSVNINPSTSVAVGTPVSVSVQGTDDNGVDQIKIWVDEDLDGDFITAGELKATCNFASVSPATCNTPSQTYSRTDTVPHAIKIEVYDTVSTVASDDTTYSFRVADQTSSNSVGLERLKINEPTIFNLSFDLSGTSTATLDVHFPAGFILGDFGATTPIGSCAGGTVSGITRISTTDIQAQKVGCQAGTVSVTNVPVTNPGSVGSYTITWSNDNGSGEVYIVD